MLRRIVFITLLLALLLVVAESLTAQPPGRGFGGRRGGPGMGPRMRPGMGSSAVLGQPPLPVNEEEKKILSILEDMDIKIHLEDIPGINLGFFHPRQARYADLHIRLVVTTQVV